MNEATIDLAIGVRSETGEVVGFTTQKARVMYEHRASFLRKEKTVIVRRIQQSIASSMVKNTKSAEGETRYWRE
ncbi:MAG: hypothetical protein M0Q46_04045 [Endomicrobiales bacterium]|nr:hypothetical protein [Endomicrobiales bacterium]